jgi:hypothetical protein
VEMISTVSSRRPNLLRAKVMITGSFLACGNSQFELNKRLKNERPTSNIQRPTSNKKHRIMVF